MCVCDSKKEKSDHVKRDTDLLFMWPLKGCIKQSIQPQTYSVFHGFVYVQVCVGICEYVCDDKPLLIHLFLILSGIFILTQAVAFIMPHVLSAVCQAMIPSCPFVHPLNSLEV